MDISSRFRGILESAVHDEPCLSTLLNGLLPFAETAWTFSEAQPGTARQGRALLAYPVKEDAGLYLVLTHTEHENDWPDGTNYLLEVMGDTPDNGTELLVIRRSGEEVTVLYRDPELQ